MSHDYDAYLGTQVERSGAIVGRPTRKVGLRRVVDTQARIIKSNCSIYFICSSRNVLHSSRYVQAETALFLGVKHPQAWMHKWLDAIDLPIPSSRLF